ncbi:hypothetical protein [Polycladidibacter hongkongensis]|uniref:hypothetical protein n=1 Tax=Polycladidibacter hongkongensis TaxID=1647556 RepID=UPI00083685E8|nr:hypothetical protein [Pseudovibrio hongkongensis]
MRLFWLTLFFISAHVLSASAASLSLESGKKWVVLASEETLVAARMRAWWLMDGRNSAPLRIVKSQNGYYAVVMGPLAVRNMDEVKKQVGLYLPQDAFLSDGSRFVTTHWKAPERVHAELRGSATAKLQLGDVRAEAKLVCGEAGCNLDDYSNSSIHLMLWLKGSPLLETTTPAGEFAAHGQSIDLIRLDPTSPYPQVVLKRFTGGAHCCVEQTIYSFQNGVWLEFDLGARDGFGGTSFDDIDGDNSFLYLFAPYAGSVAPLQFWQLKEAQLKNLMGSKATLPFVRFDLKRLELRAKRMPEQWRDAGFLAGWAASKALLGQGGVALKRILATDVEESDFGLRVCPDFSPQRNCDFEDGLQLPFVTGLTMHLIEQGYLPRALTPTPLHIQGSALPH